MESQPASQSTNQPPANQPQCSSCPKRNCILKFLFFQIIEHVIMAPLHLLCPFQQSDLGSRTGYVGKEGWQEPIWGQWGEGRKRLVFMHTRLSEGFPFLCQTTGKLALKYPRIIFLFMSEGPRARDSHETTLVSHL